MEYVKKHKFPDGVTLLYAKQNVNNSTSVDIHFVGGARLVDKQEGISHLLEHMLFNSSDDFTRDDINRFIKLSDCKLNAFTTEKNISLTFNSSNENLDIVLNKVFDMVKERNFNAEELEKEKEIVYEEIATTKEDCTNTVLCYLIDNYYNSDRLLGNKKSLKGITVDDLTNYLNKYFIKENLIVSVSSNLEFEDIINRVENAYKDKLKSKPENKVILDPNYVYDNIISVYNCYEDMNTVSISFLFPSESKKLESCAFVNIENHLMSDFDGKLFKKLRNENQFCYDAFFETISLENKIFKHICVVTSPKKVNRCIKALTQIIKDLATNGISEQELSELKMINKSRLSKISNYRSINPTNIVSAYLNNNNYYENKDIYEKVESLTKQDIDNYFKKLFDSGKIAIIFNGKLNYDKTAKMENIYNKIYPNKELDKFFEMVIEEGVLKNFDEILMQEAQPPTESAN